MCAAKAPRDTFQDARRRRAPVDLDREIGRRLRRLREARGLSQQALAGRCGLSFQQIQKYENGSNRVPASRLAALCHALDLTPAAFFAHQDEASMGKPQTEHAGSGNSETIQANAGSDPAAQFIRLLPKLDEVTIGALLLLAQQAAEARRKAPKE